MHDEQHTYNDNNNWQFQQDAASMPQDMLMMQTIKRPTMDDELELLCDDHRSRRSIPRLL